MPPTEEPTIEPTRRQWVGFWSMIVQQTQNAFNDKAAQFILVPLAGALAYSIQLGGLSLGIESVAGIMIALPFVLFAPMAGWLSDRFSKRDVMLGAAFAQLGILTWLFLAIKMRNMPMALTGFFALAIQSTFFSPAKIGINKELVGSRHLGFAAGIQQMMAMLAILIGQVAAGAVFNERYKNGGSDHDAAWAAAGGPLMVLAILGVPAIIMALIVPRTPAQGAEKLHPRIAIQHFKNMKDLWSDLPLRRGAFGVSFFWGFASLINLWSLKVAKVLTDGGEGFGALSSWFMASASLGMMLGFGLSSFLLRRRIELGWVPLAGLAMTFTALWLAWIDPTPSLALIDPSVIGFGMAFSAALKSGAVLFLGALGLLAFFAALFLAPLNAWMQDRYPANKRGELQSAVNLMNCLAGILAVVFIELLVILTKACNLTELKGLGVQLAIAGTSCGLITYYIIRLLPSDFVRVIALSVLRLFYRIQPVGPENMPKTGGLLLLPNHVTWADSFFITAASPRPVRFVMDATYMKNPAIRWFCTLFDTVPIAIGKPREALRVASEALAKGDVVCLFPEGQLTRTGTLLEMKRGFSLIARQAGAPIVPAWMDGAWGSIFSFERNRYFRKWPYRIPYGLRMAFGEVIPPKEASVEAIEAGIRKASAEAIDSRTQAWSKAGNAAEQANGYQLGQINALQRRKTFAQLSGDKKVDELAALPAFARLFKASLQSHPTIDGGEVHWVGGQELREQILNGAKPGDGRCFYDFSDQALEPLGETGWTHLPCLALDGVVVAMSLPDPPLPYERFSNQIGSKPNSYGLLLPGFYPVEHDDRITLHGPAAGPDGIHLPEDLSIDAHGFVTAEASSQVQ